MKNIFTLIFIVFCLNSIALNEPDQKSISFQKLERKVDSLSKTIENLNIEKSYFQTALNQQTGIYSLIVTAILAIIGLLSYLIIRDQNKKSEAKFKEILEKQNIEFDNLIKNQTESFSLLEADMTEQKKLISQALYTTYIALGSIKENKHNNNFRFHISAAFYAIHQEGQEISIACLKKAEECFKKLVDSPEEYREFIKEKKSELHLKEMIQSDNVTLSDLAITLLFKTNELFKQPIV